MKLKQIIANVATLLGQTDVVDLCNDPAVTEAVRAANANYNILMRCANLVASNVSSNYVDFVHSQGFSVSGTRIYFSDFEKTFLRIIKIVGNGNVTVTNYTIYSDCIEIPRGFYTVTYACVPSFAGGDDEIEILGRYSDSALVYGILAEYAFISGMFNEAKVWNEKFEQLLFSLKKTGKGIRMK